MHCANIRWPASLTAASPLMIFNTVICLAVMLEMKDGHFFHLFFLFAPSDSSYWKMLGWWRESHPFLGSVRSAGRTFWPDDSWGCLQWFTSLLTFWSGRLITCPLLTVRKWSCQTDQELQCFFQNASLWITLHVPFVSYWNSCPDFSEWHSQGWDCTLSFMFVVVWLELTWWLHRSIQKVIGVIFSHALYFPF
jgi:hypothetical protein